MAIRVELNQQGVRKLLRSKEVQADLQRRARRISAAAGDGHRVETGTTGQRARAVVVTDTYKARYGEATNRTLSRALDAGRG